MARIPFELMRDEEVLLVARPHPLSMLGLEIFWLLVGGLGVFFLLKHGDVDAYFQGRLYFDFLAGRAYDAVWIGALLAPLVVMAVFRINFGYVLVLALLIGGKAFTLWKAEQVLDLAEPNGSLDNYMLIAVGLIGMAGVELFRRGHRYYLTSHRIVARFGNLGVSERATLYSKIDDLLLQKTVLGRIFSFGTVIPVTSTGLGMGQDMAIAGVAAGAGKGGASAGLFAAGAKAKNVPRELSFYVLYRVPRPEDARTLILEEMTERERPAPREEDDEDSETGVD